jgi:hypothetical protein
MDYMGVISQKTELFRILVVFVFECDTGFIESLWGELSRYSEKATD